MLLEKVAEIENVDVSDDEVSEEIGKMAEYYKSPVEEIRASLQKQGGGEENIRNNLRTRKAIEALIAKAKVVDGEWVDETAGGAPAEAAEAPKKEAKTKAKAEKKPAAAKEPKKKAAKEKD
jgi:trigger factor